MRRHARFYWKLLIEVLVSFDGSSLPTDVTPANSVMERFSFEFPDKKLHALARALTHKKSR